MSMSSESDAEHDGDIDVGGVDEDMDANLDVNLDVQPELEGQRNSNACVA